MTDAEEILRKLLDNVISELGYREPTVEVRALTSGGANYTSALYTADIKAPCRDRLKLFAKVAIIGGKLRTLMNADTLFSTEQFIYNELVRAYENLQDKYEVTKENRFIFPKFYAGDGTVGEETVVLEDLVAQGYENFDRMKSVDWEHAASAVESLAKFHALSFAYELDNPGEFKRVADKMKSKQREDSDDETTKEVWKKLISRAVNVVKDCHKQKLIDFFEVTTRKEDFNKFRMPLSRTVLVHGDYRPSNLLFKKSGGSIETVAVDYQTVHAGCPVADLLYFMFLGSGGQFRQQHYHQLLEHYYLHLTLALGRLQVDVAEVYPREVYDSEVKEMMAPTLSISTVILPLVTVDAQNAPRTDGDVDVGEFAFDPNEVFAERFDELITDCVKWGVL